MIVDTSALVAVLLEEPGHEQISGILGSGEPAYIGAATLSELAVVMAAKRGLVGKSMVERLLRVAEIEVLPCTDEHWSLVADAYLKFGKGRHPAKLNFGDCQTYAAAVVAGEPLLFVGDDFGHTDLPIVDSR